MSKQSVKLTEQTFIHGVLRPAGYVVEVDENELGTPLGGTAREAEEQKVDVSLTPNLQKVRRGSGDDHIAYEVAAIAPTGPNPTAPQAVPPDTLESTAGTFVAPAEADGDSAGVAVVAQGSERAAQAKPRG